MTDLSKTIIAKSDQLNADDLIGRNITIKITKVSAAAGEQPIAVSYEGDNGKPWMPCKSMRRVLVGVWGTDGKAYIGRSLTLYRDEKVMFGGIEVGGIRISHMSHIDSAITMSLTSSKAKKKPFTVRPLVVQGHAAAGAAPAAPSQVPAASNEAPAALTPEEIETAQSHARKGTVALGAWWKGLLATRGEQRRYVDHIEELKRIAADADANLITEEIPL